MEQLTNAEIIHINGGGLGAMILGAICAIGDYLSKRYQEEVWDAITNDGGYGLVD